MGVQSPAFVWWLGFLNANTDPYLRSPSNYGLMDQIAALHWLQENIAYFGGDPGNVTLMGHGTGAACVHFLMTSSAPKGRNGEENILEPKGHYKTTRAILTGQYQHEYINTMLIQLLTARSGYSRPVRDGIQLERYTTHANC
ncbi:unnamed protein product [Nezara viridula]|uniref:Carboxylesterase type B domain-containing protein n=1 Tax=Nezara viridula TaxID=85310 RepID=A0A9P0MTS1_NEZVI|nr:unnamed protein product [Nezara viridula]